MKTDRSTSIAIHTANENRRQFSRVFGTLNARLRDSEYVEPEPDDARVFELLVCALVPAEPARKNKEHEPKHREHHQHYLVAVHRERAHHLTRNGWNFSVIFYGIIPSNPLASLAMTREKRNHGDSFSGKCDVIRVKTHHSLNSPACSCVSMTLPAPLRSNRAGLNRRHISKMETPNPMGIVTKFQLNPTEMFSRAGIFSIR